MLGLHAVGFQKEELFNNVLGKVLKQNEHFKSNTLKEIISAFTPDFLEGLFADRSCVRQLKYIGYENFTAPKEDCDPHLFFEIGKVYQSKSFNGGTYLIEGSARRIGSAYFDVVEMAE